MNFDERPRERVPRIGRIFEARPNWTTIIENCSCIKTHVYNILSTILEFIIIFFLRSDIGEKFERIYILCAS